MAKRVRYKGLSYRVIMESEVAFFVERGFAMDRKKFYQVPKSECEIEE